MSHQTDREDFVAQFARDFPDAPISTARTLMRLAGQEQRWSETYSSIDIGEAATARGEKASEKRDERVQAICEKLGCGLETNGDPRGSPYCLLVGTQQLRRTIPARGLPAHAFR